LPDSLVIAKARKPVLQHHFADMEQQRDASSLGSRASGFSAECFASISSTVYATKCQYKPDFLTRH